MDNKHNHICYCGGIITPHIVGDKGCFRYITEAPDFTKFSEFIYKQQRGYHQHECGCWSRWEGSYNSIEEK